MVPILRIAVAALCLTPLAAEVSRLHPRIYVRHDDSTIGKGITVRELKRRAHDAGYAKWRRDVDPRSAAAAMEAAARYLEDGRKEDLAAVRDFLSTHSYSYEKNDVGGFLAGAEMAAAYDWIHSGLTENERAAVMQQIAATTDSSFRFLQRGGADVNHNYTYMALSSVAVSGLVLSGEEAPYGAKGEEYLASAKNWLEGTGKVLDTWSAREGAWGEGSHYTFHETLRTLVLTLAAYRSATDADYFPRIRDTWGNFAVKAGWFLMAATRPDMTFERLGDSSSNRVTAINTVALTAEMLAAGLDNPVESPHLRSYARDIVSAYGPNAVHAYYGWGMRIFHNPADKTEPSYRTLPLFLRLGAGTYEHIMMRDGWGPGSTLITMIAGDHFTDHQHFDKGSFLIYHRGGLTIDGGAYDKMYAPGEHWSEYATRTVAHNAVLVIDPEEQMPKGYGNDGGQRVIRGRQHHHSWPDFLAHRDDEGLHGARVLAAGAEAGNRWQYVKADLAKAYAGKVTSYQRELLYLPPSGLLAVLDRVTSSGDFAKRWLLHFQDAPSIDGTSAEEGIHRYENARTIAVERKGSAELGGEPVGYSGALFVEPLLPVARTVTVIGGPGYEYYNGVAGKNYPVSNPRIAAEARESGRWRMETAAAKDARETVFLHLLHVADAGAAAPKPAQPIRGDRVSGAASGAWAVVFAEGSLPVAYEAPATDHVVAGLPPDQAVTVDVAGRATASKTTAEGVLHFRAPANAQRIIIHR